MKKTGNIMHDLLNCTIGKETKAEVKNKEINLDKTFLETVFIINIYHKYVTAQEIFASVATSQNTVYS